MRNKLVDAGLEKVLWVICNLSFIQFVENYHPSSHMKVFNIELISLKYFKCIFFQFLNYNIKNFFKITKISVSSKSIKKILLKIKVCK